MIRFLSQRALTFHNEAIVFIEVKDFRGNRIENKPRTENGDDPLEIEVAQKVKHSLAVLLSGARKSTNNRDFWRKCAQLIPNEEATVHVILWLEEDALPHPTAVSEKRQKAVGGFLTNRLQTKVSWLTKRAFVAKIGAVKKPYDDALNVSYRSTS